MASNCKMCGMPNTDGVQFCSSCGHPMQGNMGQAKREAPKSKGVAAKTMMFGMKAPQIPETKQPPAAQSAPVATAPMATMKSTAQPNVKPVAMSNKTMFGVPAMTAAAQKPKVQQAAPVAQPAPMAKPVQSTPSPSPTVSADALLSKRTVLGMPAVSADDVAKTVAAMAGRAVTPPVAGPESSSSPEPAPTPVQPEPSPAHPETVPLEPLPKSDPPPPTSQPLESEVSSDDNNTEDSWLDDEVPTKKSSSNALIIVAVIAGSIIISGLGFLLYLLVFKAGPELQPQIFPTQDGQGITVILNFPNAPMGSTVQVQDQLVKVIGRQVRFDLPKTQMQVGPNLVNVIYTATGSPPENLNFPIMLRHTTLTDLSGLVAAQPFFVVNFQVAQGIKLAVNGKIAQLINGVFSHQVKLSSLSAISDETSDNLIHRIPFQLTNEKGVAEQGQHIVTIPATSLQVDRPAADAVVATEEITCSGSAEEGATVTVNGQAVGVSAAGFNTTVPLIAIGNHKITVVARSPGKVPRTQTLKITRIQNLNAAIKEWAKDLEKKLDYPNLARDVNAQLGKKVKINGRIVNISTEKGVTAFLMYVGEGCPAGARCAVYVAFRGETDAGLQSMVNVYGTVRGTRDVELRGGKKETMPALDASFVIRDEGKKKKRHKRRKRR